MQTQSSIKKVNSIGQSITGIFKIHSENYSLILWSRLLARKHQKPGKFMSQGASYIVHTWKIK